jgi:hypothetical protein
MSKQTKKHDYYEIKKEIKKGTPRAQIARMFGCPATTVTYCMSEVIGERNALADKKQSEILPEGKVFTSK